MSNPLRAAPAADKNHPLLGLGFNSFKGDLAFRGLKADAGLVERDDQEVGTKFRLDYIDSAETFEKAMAISAGAKASYGFINGSMALEHQEHASRSRFQRSLLATVRVVRDCVRLVTPELADGVPSPRNNPQAFLRRYGDMFVRAVRSFSSVQVLFTYEATTEAELRSSSGSFKTSIMDWGASAAFRDAVSRASAAAALKPRVITAGYRDSVPIDAGGNMLSTIDWLINFASHVNRKGDAAFSSQIAELDDWWAAVDLKDGFAGRVQGSRSSIKDLKKRIASLSGVAADARFVKQNPELFWPSPAPQQLDLLSQQASAEIARLHTIMEHYDANFVDAVGAPDLRDADDIIQRGAALPALADEVVGLAVHHPEAQFVTNVAEGQSALLAAIGTWRNKPDEPYTDLRDLSEAHAVYEVESSDGRTHNRPVKGGLRLVEGAKRQGATVRFRFPTGSKNAGSPPEDRVRVIVRRVNLTDEQRRQLQT